MKPQAVEEDSSQRRSRSEDNSTTWSENISILCEWSQKRKTNECSNSHAVNEKIVEQYLKETQNFNFNGYGHDRGQYVKHLKPDLFALDCLAMMAEDDKSPL